MISGSFLAPPAQATRKVSRLSPGVVSHGRPVPSGSPGAGPKRFPRPGGFSLRRLITWQSKQLPRKECDPRPAIRSPEFWDLR